MGLGVPSPLVTVTSEGWTWGEVCTGLEVGSGTSEDGIPGSHVASVVWNCQISQPLATCRYEVEIN